MHWLLSLSERFFPQLSTQTQLAHILYLFIWVIFSIKPAAAAAKSLQSCLTLWKLHTLNLCYCAYKFLWHFQTYYIISILLIVLHQSPSALMSTFWWEACLSLFWLVCLMCPKECLVYIRHSTHFCWMNKWNITMILASRLNFQTILLCAILFKAKLSKKNFFNYENMITHLQEIWKIYNSYI